MNGISSAFIKILEKLEVFFISKKYLISKFFLFIALILIGPFLTSKIEESIIARILSFFIYYLFLNLLGNFISTVIIALYLSKNKYPKGHVDNFTIGIERITSFLTIIIFIFILLRLLTINIPNLLTSISIFSVALILTFRDYLSNFIQGMALMFSTNFKIGEEVEIGEKKGKIVDMDFLNVKLRSIEGDTIFIPNMYFLTKEVVNISKGSSKKMTSEFKIDSQIYKYYLELEERIKFQINQKFENSISGLDVSISSIENLYSNLRVDISLNQKLTNKLEKEINDEISKTIVVLYGEKVVS